MSGVKEEEKEIGNNHPDVSKKTSCNKNSVPIPKPDNLKPPEISLSATTEYACYSPASQHQCWAVVTSKAPFYEASSRASVDIVAVIDRSGSMTGHKLLMVKNTLLFVIDQLKSGDRLSLVVYDSCVDLIFELMNMTTENKRRAKTFVASIRIGSSTNLSGGLIKGMQQIALTAKEVNRAKVQSVLLFTDGLATRGITDHAGILKEMRLLQTQGIGSVQMPKASDDLMSSMLTHSGIRKSSVLVQRAFSWVTDQRAVGKPIHHIDSAAVEPEIQKGQPNSPSRQQPIQRPSKFLSSFHWAKPRQPDNSTAWPQDTTSSPIPQSVWNIWHPQSQDFQSLPEQKHVTFVSSPTCSGSIESSVDLPKPDLKFDGTVYTFGFGSDHCTPMLEAISTQGGGVYYYIDSSDKIPQCFADCLGGLLSVVGQNMILKLEVRGDCLLKHVHANRPVIWTEINKSCEIKMGDIQSEESRDVVLELQLPSMLPGSSLKQTPLVKAELSYFNVITSQFDTMQCLLRTDRLDGDPGKSNVTVDSHRNRIMVAHSLKEAESLASEEKFEEARRSIHHTMTTLTSSPSRNDALTQSLIKDSARSMKGLESSRTYSTHGRHYLSSRSQSHAIQRTNYVDQGESNSLYANTSKSVCIEKAKKSSSSAAN